VATRVTLCTQELVWQVPGFKFPFTHHSPWQSLTVSAAHVAADTDTEDTDTENDIPIKLKI